MNFEELLSSVLLLLCNVAYFAGGQHIAPGVPPQHYQQQGHIPQQQVPVQQYQQQHVPMQQQQMQMTPQQIQQQQQMQMQQQQQMHIQQPHMQQVPVQQQQVPVQQQQMHHQPAHHGHAGGHSPQVLNVANIAQEKEHIAEHMSVPIDTSKMSEQELQFHYFKMHDADNNNKLDGCELIKSLIHWHAQGHSSPTSGQKAVEEKLFKDDELVSLIDPILSLDDANKDGFIDYPEFVRAQQKAAAAGGPPQHPQR